jgi:hypothetical protein
MKSFPRTFKSSSGTLDESRDPIDMSATEKRLNLAIPER